jgi:hypothetical protein
MMHTLEMPETFSTDTRADLSLRNSRDLIHHQSANGAQAIAFIWLDR